MTPRSIADEIKQTRPFRSLSQEAVVTLLRTANVLSRRLDAVCQSEGITHQQYNVLRILRGAKGPLPTMEVADRMIEQTPGITRHANNLESRGLIRREQWSGDRRQTLCQITPAGLRLLERVDPAIDELDDAFSGRVTREQLENFLEVLALLRPTDE